MDNYKNKRAFFFDLDDTLYDQLLPFKEAVLSSYKCKEGFPFEQIFKKSREYSDVLWTEYKLGKLSLEQLRVERLVRAFTFAGFPLTEGAAREIQEKYEERQHSIELFHGVKPFISELKERKFVIGIITNGPVKHQWRKITNLELKKEIDSQHIFVSDGVGIAKPDPKLFLHVNERLGIHPKDCYYLGDSWANDVVSSSKAGWNAIWYNYRNREPKSTLESYKVIRNYHFKIDTIF
ncbi:putative hydrolase of the HAD superfamily [Evansella vedderi]|uniref:Hydrolase of the HAD superfamily n=1 Tax=Evansella vedderi TaxID=38282 RepID=A0ABU0A0M9_9BACI|nr:HAD family hydrolase [Evansella vedderi]MDQ0256775.1 putative hydrolase of the HAD superfamily [Evansella vedderi]